MKGICYGGVLHFPLHPSADMHGLVRACVRVSSRLEIEPLLLSRGLPTIHQSHWLDGVWQESQSVAEQQATGQCYGQLLICKLAEQYLRVEAYEPLPALKSLPKGKKRVGVLAYDG